MVLWGELACIVDRSQVSEPSVHTCGLVLCDMSVAGFILGCLEGYTGRQVDILCVLRISSSILSSDGKSHISRIPDNTDTAANVLFDLLRDVHHLASWEPRGLRTRTRNRLGIGEDSEKRWNSIPGAPAKTTPKTDNR